MYFWGLQSRQKQLLPSKHVYNPLLLKSSFMFLILTVLIILSSSEINNDFWIRRKEQKNVSVVFLVMNTQLSVALLQFWSVCLVNRRVHLSCGCFSVLELVPTFLW